MRIAPSSIGAEHGPEDECCEAEEDYEEFNDYDGEGGPAPGEVGGVGKGEDRGSGFLVVWV